MGWIWQLTTCSRRSSIREAHRAPPHAWFGAETGSTPADSAKASNRYRLTAEDRYNFLGFRVARGAGEGPGGPRSSIGSH